MASHIYEKLNLEIFSACIQLDILLLPFVLQKEESVLQPSAALPAYRINRDASEDGLWDVSEIFSTFLHTYSASHGTYFWVSEFCPYGNYKTRSDDGRCRP
jgi:hypothetical protein